MRQARSNTSDAAPRRRPRPPATARRRLPAARNRPGRLAAAEGNLSDAAFHDHEETWPDEEAATGPELLDMSFDEREGGEDFYRDQSDGVRLHLSVRQGYLDEEGW
ncbi:hypothetical protein [Methylobacterium radiodurans]|uniref:Uncharacterized protein n=1 Tax=Methylobacterium radiodurans TaxID=2202828 RepID=A0A2U8VV77_9HYPH|nr:hypothetical protein [Methylobacterium radiodurans]AWN37704.1 hypothetical protein DK427_19860 [Methylobacterium radiodurans]